MRSSPHIINVIMRILLYNVNCFSDIVLAGNIIVRSQTAVGAQIRSLANRPTAIPSKATAVESIRTA